MAGIPLSKFERLRVEYDFQRLENLKKEDPIRFQNLFYSSPVINKGASLNSGFSDKKRFGWDEDYDLEIVFRNTNGTILHAESFEQFQLNFIGSETPTQKIVVYNLRYFVNILYHFQKHSFIFSEQKLPSVIAVRCIQINQRPIKESSVSTYVWESENLNPLPLTETIVAKLKRSKLRSD